MSPKFSKRQTVLVVALVFLAGLSLLLWEHFNGGVASHHLLNRSDLPSISNWWGLAWLPLLTFIAIKFIEKSKSKNTTIAAGFIGSWIYSAVFAFCFSYGYEAATTILFPGMFLIAIFVPVYRAEYLLGFVFGLTFTLGAILPTLVGGALALLSALIHLVIRPLLLRAFRWLTKQRQVNKV